MNFSPDRTANHPPKTCLSSINYARRRLQPRLKAVPCFRYAAMCYSRLAGRNPFGNIEHDDYQIIRREAHSRRRSHIPASRRSRRRCGTINFPVTPRIESDTNMVKSVKSRAEEQFAATQKRDQQALKEKEVARHESAERVSKLRGLRMAKEASDKQAAEQADAEKEAAKVKKAKAKAKTKVPAKAKTKAKAKAKK